MTTTPDVAGRLAAMSQEQREFALSHLAYHIHQSRRHEALYRLVDRPWQDAHVAHAGSYAGFAKDVALAIDMAAARFPADVVELWRCVLISVRIRAASSRLTTGIIRLLAQLGRHQTAMGWAALAEDGQQRSRNYLAIAEVLYERRQIDPALTALRQALVAARAEEPGRSREHAFAAVGTLAERIDAKDVLRECLTVVPASDAAESVTAELADESPADAFAAAEEIEKPHRRSAALRNIGRRALAANDDRTAVAAARRAMTAARLVDPEDYYSENLYEPVEAVVASAELLWDAGEREVAVSAALDMLHVPQFLCDPTYGPDALGGIIAIFGKAGETAALEEALEIGEALDDSTFRDTAITAVIRALAEAGAVERALELGRRHDFVSLSIEAVASRLLEKGDDERAAAVLDQAFDQANAIQVANFAAVAYRAVAEALLGTGMAAEAKQAADRAYSAARHMYATSVSEDVFANGKKAIALARIATTYMRLGDHDSAVAVAREAIEESSPQTPRLRSSIYGETWRIGVGMWGNQEAVRAEVAPILEDSPGPEPQIVDNPIATLAEWRDVCVAAATLDLENVYRLLERSTGLLTSIDAGRTLWQLFERTIDVSNWR